MFYLQYAPLHGYEGLLGGAKGLALGFLSGFTRVANAEHSMWPHGEAAARPFRSDPDHAKPAAQPDSRMANASLRQQRIGDGRRQELGRRGLTVETLKLAQSEDPACRTSRRRGREER